MNTEIFKLIKRHGFEFSSNSDYELTDNNYFAFQEAYLEFAIERDLQLQKYLLNSQTYFRTYIPFRDGILDTLSEIVWYYDEILVGDPIVYTLLTNQKYLDESEYDSYEEKVESIKYSLKEVINSLKEFKELIDEDFVLFDSSLLLPNSNLPFSYGGIETKIIKELIRDPIIYRALDEELYAIKGKLKIGSRAQKFYEIHYKNQKESDAIMGYVGESANLQLHQHPNTLLSLIETPKKVSVKELRKKRLSLLKKARKRFYPSEIIPILEALKVSSEYNSGAFLTSKFDETMVNYLSGVPNNLHGEHHSFIKFGLPYLNHLHTNDLLNLRAKMPQAFIDFRRELNLVIQEINTKHEHVSSDLIQELANERLDRIIQGFDSEIKTSLKSIYLTGVAAPIISGIGYLQTGLFMIGFQALIAGISLIPLSKRIIDHQKLKDEQKKQPFYFLWKVKNKK